MSKFYDSLILTAASILKEFGGDGNIILKRTSGVVNSITGALPVGGGTSIELVGIVSRYETPSIDGTRIRTDDRRVIVDATVEPTKDDHIEIAGILLTIVGVKKIAPGGQDVVYVIQARQ